MRFVGRELEPEVLRKRGIEPPKSTAGAFPREAYVQTTANLLDRLRVEATSHVMATRSEGSIVVALQTDPAFRGPGPSENRWEPLRGDDRRPRSYVGGSGYLQISRYKPVDGALIVESHLAFFEPKAWFDGNPILRSKLALIAQDQIRSLRRELKKSQGE